MGRGMRVEGSMNYVLDISAAAGEFGAENWINYVLEKLREIGRAMSPEEWINFVREKLREIGRAISPEEWINFVREKLKEFLAVLQHFGKIFMAKVDEVFPPETRVEQLKHWARVAAPYIVAAVAVVAFLILLRYFIGCCCRVVGCCCRVVGGGVSVVIKTMKTLLCYFSRCCCRVVGGGGSVVKTMIAPGTAGAVRILRAPFGANPALYFRGLRGR